jgi:hypothetical protein
VPPVWGVVQQLGLDPEVVLDVAEFENMRARQAMDADWDVGHPGDRADYICDHGFRAIGLLLPFDQDAAAQLGVRLRDWLLDWKNPFWPLTFATTSVDDADSLGQRLNDEPYTTARDLCRCLVPQSLTRPASGRPAGPDATRAALAPYGVDLELLQLIVLGRTPGTDPAVVSDISMPALVRTLFASMEAALAQSRADGYHWSAGLSVVQATDPEVLLAVRAVLRSAAAPHARDLPEDLLMGRALVRLVDEAGI